ncbi:MAG TPA: hypothetical protein ENK60_02630 [Anaerolineae bacterium]|nr:hypothetical protein [Anaerolineae bacterium]
MTSIAIVGNPPFADALASLCRKAGHRVEVHDAEVLNDAAPGHIPLSDKSIVIDFYHHSDKSFALWNLESLIPPSTLVLTSALPSSVTLAGYDMGLPERLVGFSIIPPLNQGDPVEVARGLRTSDNAFRKALEFWQSLDLEPVEVGDGPGLVRARVLACLVNEAISALAEGVATARDIDTAMKLGTNYPRGPLEWGAYLGMDTIYGVMRGLHQEWGEDRYRPHPLLRRIALADAQEKIWQTAQR